MCLLLLLNKDVPELKSVVELIIHGSFDHVLSALQTHLKRRFTNKFNQSSMLTVCQSNSLFNSEAKWKSSQSARTQPVHHLQLKEAECVCKGNLKRLDSTGSFVMERK